MSWPPAGAVRVDTLKAHQRFRAMDGVEYEYVRQDGALSGAHHVKDVAADRITQFAGCAEVVLLERKASQ